MDELHHSLLLQILSRLDDSADVARCRVAYKPFNTVFPDLRSINLRCSRKWCIHSTSSTSSSSKEIKPLKAVFMELISKMKRVESVCVGFNMLHGPVETERQSDDNSYLIDVDFAIEWLPMVSESLKSLSICGLPHHWRYQSNFLSLVSKYCYNLVELNLKFARLSVDNLNPMPTLTSLTLAFTTLEDEHLNELNKCFPNLQVLNLVGVKGFKDPKVHLLNLHTFHWAIYNHSPSLTLITPNLITLKIESFGRAAIHVEAPMLSHFHLAIVDLKHAGAFTAKKFENLKTLWMDSLYTGSLLSEFPITKTVETLTLES